MGVNFDKLCDIVLNEGKSGDVKFAKLIVGNSDPFFSQEDVLRDPTDPSKGTKLYLADKEAKVKGVSPGDPQSIRRQLRRINWVARKLIKKYNGKEVDLEKLTRDISTMLEEYQTKVLGWDKTDKANTGYEARVIGNLLLPPTKRVPNGKSVFIVPGMDPNAGPEQGSVKVKPARTSRSPKLPRLSSSSDRSIIDGPEAAPVSADDLQRRFEQMSQHFDAFFDDDLFEVITSKAAVGTTVNDILKDPRVRDVFNTDSVKEVIRGLIKSGKLVKGEDGQIKISVKPSQGAKLYKSVASRKEQDIARVADDISKDAGEDAGYAPPSDDFDEVDYINKGGSEVRPAWYPSEEDVIDPLDTEEEEPVKGDNSWW